MAADDLTEEEIRRYARHIVLPEMGGVGQARLKAGSVLVIGAGGLGSPLLLYLAAAGVGRIGVVDDDRVDVSTSSGRSYSRPRRRTSPRRRWRPQLCAGSTLWSRSRCMPCVSTPGMQPGSSPPTTSSPTAATILRPGSRSTTPAATSAGPWSALPCRGWTGSSPPTSLISVPPPVSALPGRSGNRR